MTSAAWKGLVIQTAPLNPECEKSSDPAIEFTAEDVSTKNGYDSIRWDASAHLIWGSNLKGQNTIRWPIPRVET